MTAAAQLDATDDTGLDRDPPHDTDAEKIVIGATLGNRRALESVAEILRPADFYRSAHAIIYTTTQEMADAGQPLDPVAVVAELTKRGDITRMGGAPYLHECIARVPTAASAAYYARIVSDKAALRRLVEAGQHITQIGRTGDGDTEHLVEYALDTLTTATAATTAPAADLWVSDRYPGFLDRLERPVDHSRSVPAPYVDLRAYVPALRAGNLVIVGARPATGKSTIGLDAIRYTAIRHDMPALLASMEMDGDEILERLTAAEARVSYTGVREHDLTEGQWTAVGVATGRIAEAPILIDDTATQSLGHLRSRLRHMARTRPARLAVVDYLGLMEAPAHAERESRQQAVAALSRGLKQIAKEFQIPVLALAQLNRAVVSRADKRPTMSDLRESGQIEADADVIILMHRPDADEKESPRSGEIDLIIAKNRGGPTGEVTVSAQLHYARLADLSRHPQA